MLDPASVSTAINALTDFLLRYFVALAAVGALTMAILEAWKKIFDSRTRFQMNAVLRWIGVEGERDFRVAALIGRRSPPSPQRAYVELMHLTTGTELPEITEVTESLLQRHSDIAAKLIAIPRDAGLALFSLELGRMMGHIQDAADTVLRDPKRYAALYDFLTWGAKDQDANDWRDQAYSVAAALTPQQSNDRANLYSRITGAERRKLDGFQLYTDYRWTNLNQLVANIVGSMLLLYALIWSQLTSGREMSGLTWVLLIAVSLVGGALAPVAKDIVMALERARRGV